MEITINKTNDCEATLNATVPTADVATIKDGIIASYIKSARVPGFRPGKAPKSVIAKRYADMIAEELNARLKADIQEKALSDNPALKVIDFGTPECGEQADGSYTYTSTMTIVPEFELPEYMGLEVTVSSTEVTEEEVDAALQQTAERAAEYIPCDHAAAMGDIAVIDFTTTVQGQPVAEFCGQPVGFLEGRQGHWHHMKQDTFMPGLSEGLVGLSAGESKDIEITLVEDFPISAIAGKMVTFSCTVKEVREKKVPEVTPALFAKTMPNKSMEEIREAVAANLKLQKENSNDEAKADQISEQLADKLSFSLPEALIENELTNTIQQKMYAAFQAGNFNLTNDMDALREEARTETIRNLRIYFALQEIARRENITCADSELYNAIAAMAQRAGEKNLRNYIKKLQRENSISGIRASIITSKTVALLADNAKVTVSEGAQAEA